MKCVVILLSVISCSLALSPALKAAGPGPVPPYADLECQKGMYGPGARSGKALKACFDPQVYGEGEGKIHPNCSAFCQNKALGLVDSNNLPKIEIHKKFVEEKFPEQYKALGRRHFAECFEKFGKIDLDDPTCKMAADFNTCSWSVQPKLTC